MILRRETVYRLPTQGNPTMKPFLKIDKNILYEKIRFFEELWYHLSDSLIGMGGKILVKAFIEYGAVRNLTSLFINSWLTNLTLTLYNNRDGLF